MKNTNQSLSSAAKNGLYCYIGFSVLIFIMAATGIMTFEDPSTEGTINALSIFLLFIVYSLVIARTYRNYIRLEKLSKKHLSYRTIWGIIGRFIPIASRFIPFTIMREMNQGYHTLAKSVEHEKETNNKIFWRQILQVICSLLIGMRPKDDDSVVIFIPTIGLLLSLYLLASVINDITLLQQKSETQDTQRE